MDSWLSVGLFLVAFGGLFEVIGAAAFRRKCGWPWVERSWPAKDWRVRLYCARATWIAGVVILIVGAVASSFG
jgi:hypothetical protein